MPRLLARAGQRAIVGAALAFAAGSVAGGLTLACASAPGGQPRRNGMEAPPPFPVAPDFTLPDADGTARSLASLMGPKGLVLVLYRGHW
ncbi:MAG: hypothetical protein JNK56_37110 [Myxococcales bacterium]|nr:hypothetical protein [Myxococcales bacterium]